MSTTKTVFGFMRAWLGRRFPFMASSSSLEDVFNYRNIDGLFPTSGQPSEEQLQKIGESGFSTVINLAPTSVLENSVVEEAAILADQGVNYVHIPVDFNAPSDNDFERFVEAVDSAGHDKLWVHCAANMRVSAFVYRYRVTVLNEDVGHARKDLEQIWSPFGVWKAFIGDAQ